MSNFSLFINKKIEQKKSLQNVRNKNHLKIINHTKDPKQHATT